MKPKFEVGQWVYAVPEADDYMSSKTCVYAYVLKIIISESKIHYELSHYSNWDEWVSIPENNIFEGEMDVRYEMRRRENAEEERND